MGMQQMKLPIKTTKVTTGRVSIEMMLSVDYNFKGDFEEARLHVPHEQQMRTAIKDWLSQAGIARARSREFWIVEQPVFVEFDSGNPSHAAAFYLFSVQGPLSLIKQVEEWEASL